MWLNEGYATFAEFLCVANLYPEYDMWTQFVTETWSPALKLDALKNSHPIEVRLLVNCVSLIVQKFKEQILTENLAGTCGPSS